MLKGKRGFILGVANDSSIAWGCAKASVEQGATVAVSYLNEKAEKYVRPLAESISAPIIMPCDVQKEGELESVFDELHKQWGGIDFVLHSIAYAPLNDLHGRVIDCSLDGFLKAMDISCHSFIRLAKLAEPLMNEGGSILTTTYFGSRRVVDSYNMMGPVKAALESTTRYLARELGTKGIRVNAISPGPMATRAASGINNFQNLLDKAVQKAPTGLVTLEDVGALAAFLFSDGARAITGNIEYVDGGYHSVD